MTIQIWRYTNVRQARYGFPTGKNPMEFVGLLESHGELDLYVQYGTPMHQVGELPDDATTEEKWSALAKLEEWTLTTYASQQQAREEARIADEADL